MTCSRLGPDSKRSTPETLRLLFTAFLRAAMAPLAPGVPVPDDLLEGENVLAEDVEAWKQKVTQQARQEGRQQGRQEAEAAVLLRLERRFGVLPGWVSERVSVAEMGALAEWSLRVLDAGSLDDVFA